MISRLEIEEFLEQNDYLAVAKPAENGILLILPESRFLHENVLKEGLYQIRYEDTNAILSLDEEELIEVPAYSARWRIAIDICNTLHYMGYPMDYLCVKDYDDTKVGFGFRFIEYMPEPDNKEEKEKDGILQEVFTEAWKEGFPIKYELVAKNMDVLEGYNALKDEICQRHF